MNKLFYVLALFAFIVESSWASDSTMNYKSDFERAIEKAPLAAREPKEYHPPNPHEGRYPVTKDISVGGTANPPSVNIKQSTNLGK